MENALLHSLAQAWSYFEWPWVQSLAEAWSVLKWPFATCILLVAIHGYLGYHVISRGVIFVDLSLAQIAALGAMIAIALTPGNEPSGGVRYVASLMLAIVGAGLFALTGSRHRREGVPQEATIGIVYAVAASLLILLANSLPHGAQVIEETLVGSILWVDQAVFLKTLAIYTCVGILHVVFRKQFFEISADAPGADARGLHVRAYDFLFYASFAVVITSSVAISGVLLVFSFLVMPAAAGVLLAESIPARLLVGWVGAILGSTVGLAASWAWDLPTGAAIVTSLGGLLALAAIASSLLRRGGSAS